MKPKYFTGGTPLKQGQPPQYFTGGTPLQQGAPQQFFTGGAPLQQQLAGLLGGGGAGMYALGGMGGGGADALGGMGGGGGVQALGSGAGGGGIMGLLGQLFGGGGGGGVGGGGSGLSPQMLAGLLSPSGGMGGGKMGHYQQVGLGGNIGGIDIPPADMGDPFAAYTPHELGASFGFGGGNPLNNPWYNPSFASGGPTTQNPFGGQGTMLPTYWDQQGYPFAVPVSTGDVNATAPNWFHAGQVRKNV